MIYWKLFLSFLQIGLLSVGGGYAAMPLIQAQVVTENSWLTMAEFVDLVTIAEMTPGPIAINAATFVGIRVAGFGGAVIATLGCIFPSLILVSIMAFVYFRFKKLSLLQSVLASLRPAVVALIASAGVSVAIQVIFSGGEIVAENISYVETVLFLGAFLVLRKFKWNPILVMSLCGLCSLLVGIVI